MLMHESGVAPGGVVHEIYSHPGDELFLVREGTLEVEMEASVPRWARRRGLRRRKHDVCSPQHEQQMDSLFCVSVRPFASTYSMEIGKQVEAAS